MRVIELPFVRVVGVLAASDCLSPAAVVIVEAADTVILLLPGVPDGKVIVPPALGSAKLPPTALRL